VLHDNTKDTTDPFSLRGRISNREATKFGCSIVDPGNNQGYTVPNNIDADEIPISRTFIGACQPSWRLGKTPIIKESGRRRTHWARGNEGRQTSASRRWFVGKESLLYLPVIAYARNLQTPHRFSDLSSLSSLSGNSDVEAGLKSNDFSASEPIS